MAGHALALEHASRGLALADRARRAVEQRGAVRSRATREVVPLDGAGEALADGGAGHVDGLALGEHVDLELGAGGEFGAFASGEAEFDERFARLDLRLGEVTRGGTRDARRLLVAERHLDGAIAIALDTLDLGDAVGQSFDHRHRDRFARVREDARHAGLAANQTDRHLCVLIHRHSCDWLWLIKLVPGAQNQVPGSSRKPVERSDLPDSGQSRRSSGTGKAGQASARRAAHYRRLLVASQPLLEGEEGQEVTRGRKSFRAFRAFLPFRLSSA